MNIFRRTDVALTIQRQRQQIVMLEAALADAEADAAHVRSERDALATQLDEAQDKAKFYMEAFCDQCKVVKP